MKNLTVKMRIKSSYRDMSPKEKQIADYILKNIKLVSRSTISDISRNLGIADSTFYQFTKKLGYEGFKDFKINLLTEEFDPEISIHEKISKDDDADVIVQKVFDSSIKALEDTRKITSGSLFKEAALTMLNAKNVWFFGVGGSNAVALDGFHKFMRSPIKCGFTSDYHMQLMNASLLTPDDCAFIISHTGLSREILEIAKIVKENGAKLIVLTSYYLSPLAKMADIVLVSTSEEIAYRSESLSSRLSQLCIIDALFVITMFHDETKANASLKKIRHAIAHTKEQHDIYNQKQSEKD